MRRLRETNNITDCAKIYNDLLGKKYTVILEDNISFSFYFTRKAFFHLLVLEKLNKLYEFKGKSKQIIYNEILNATFPIAAIENHNQYKRVVDRIIYFDSIKKHLNKKHSKLIIDFNADLVPHTKLTNTKFMFFAHENTGYTHFTVAQKGNLFYPETFIYENSKRYISEQTLLDVKDIIIKPIK